MNRRVQDRERSAASRPERPLIWGGIALILAAAFLGTRLSDDVSWTGSDFAAAALLLGAAAMAYELATWRGTRARRILIGAAIGAVTALIWAQGAVGIF